MADKDVHPGGRVTTVLCILGSSRSGSTLLDRLLGATPAVASLGEVHQLLQRGILNEELCGCGSSVVKCPFWSEVLRGSLPTPFSATAQRLLSKQRPAVSNKHLLRSRIFHLPSRQAAKSEAEYGSVLAAVLASASHVSGCPVLVDSSKRASHAMLLVNQPSIRVVAVQIVRDSRAVAFSVSRHRLRPEVVGKEAYMARLTTWQAAMTWTRANVLSAIVARAANERLLVRYEDLVSNPVHVVAQIRDAAGLTTAGPDELRNSLNSLPQAHTVSGNPMRFTQGPLRISVDDEWRHAMPTSRRLQVTALTAPLLIAYRYRLRTAHRSQPRP